ncbi:hypothetical protein EJB05_00829 [Eragrostis curvula]|uniref:Fe2OG dioxygenase domain-containing protein n=1 Tax=Eragrostis curvula TaxID=38414 RepID=A0A5J9WNH0_9POAL|nr:hypothetical protein EJB05_00829 [Eragrostis curvula]
MEMAPIAPEPEEIPLPCRTSQTPKLEQAPMASAPAGFDRLSEIKAFDDTKAGVKGLVDAGVTAIPRIFHHPPDHWCQTPGACRPGKVSGGDRGFFQVVNHQVPQSLMSEMLEALRTFHEQPVEVKRPYYTRDMRSRVRYHSNFDLFSSPAATWRDTIYMEMAPIAPAPEEIPLPCREVALEYTRQVQRLGGVLLELMSEALGLHPGYLEHDAGCLDGISVVGHYYPPCPEPHLTLGTTRQSDPSFFTVLLQDSIGGLQVVHGGRWVDVPPVPGALLVNIGDFLQLMSNDRFKSVEHRVLAMGSRLPRVSMACFFRPRGEAASTRVYGPINMRDTTSPPSPPLYQSITAEDFINHYMDMGLVGKICT